MLAEERQLWILREVHERGHCSVAGLARELRRSDVTIRNDLRALEERGLLRRTHGGAAVLGRTENLGDLVGEEEQRIALAAVRLIREGDALSLDSSSVALVMAPLLLQASFPMTVVTNALSIAELLGEAPLITTLVLGGTLCREHHALFDAAAAEMVSWLRVDLAFLGPSGVDATRGVTAPSPKEASLLAAYAKGARRRVVVAYSGKLGCSDGECFAAVDEVDLIITGRRSSPREVALLRGRGLEVSLV